MRNFSLLICIAALSLSCALQPATRDKNTAAALLKLPIGGAIDTDDEEAFSDSLIEENPDFVPPEDEEDEDMSDSDSDNDGDSDSDGDIDDDDDKNDAKKKLSKKLKKKNRLKILKKNRLKITLALAVFAFRREIRMFLWSLLAHSFRDPTSILKLILFVDFMRRMQTGGSEDGGGGSNLVKAFGGFFNDNPAYLPPVQQHFCFESLNEYYLKDGMALQKAMRNKHEGLKWPSSSTRSMSSPFKSRTSDKISTNTSDDRTVVVLDWTKLDQELTSMKRLREEISFLLSEYRSLVMQGEQSNSTNSTPPLEVVLLLESPGGSVPDYGLAGQHLLRLRNEPGVTLTICVDKVAASGGYMLCCTASPGKLYASPFAYLGSIGVIATQVNVRKLLTKYGVEPLEYRGGRFKAPIGLLGKITKDGQKVTQTMVDDIHQAFKEHVVSARPILQEKIEEIGNGSVWLGTNALALGLVDGLKTSDEYIQELIKDGSRVFRMLQAPRSTFLFGPKLGHYSTIESAKSKSSIKDDTLVEESKTMLRLPAQAKALFKSLQSAFP